MMPFRLLPGYALLYLALFAVFGLALLQNVTIDDAVLTGTVIPQYLPNTSVWNIGNTCTTCFVQPNPSLAYDGTWHDTTFSTSNSFTQEIQFTFTGSALYIFFIIANYVPGATTLTNITFLLDSVADSTYTHIPLSSSDYQYNVSVYANDAMAFGEHNMTIQPLNLTTNMLMLFDYLIYTTDLSSSVSASASATSTSTSSATLSATQVTSSGPSTGAIVGGVVGGVIALVLVIASLLCYWRRKNHNTGGSVAKKEAVVEHISLSSDIAPTSPADTMSSTHQPFVRYSLAGSKTRPSVSTLPTSNPPSSAATPSSFGGSSSNQPGLLEQVEMLRNEVAHLRQLHNAERNMFELQSEAPPEYS